VQGGIIAKLAYLTTPAPNIFMLNIQLEDGVTFVQFEISKAHLANILVEGSAMALREYVHRVPAASQTESAHERVGS
jgi:hypothetical protein